MVHPCIPRAWLQQVLSLQEAHPKGLTSVASLTPESCPGGRNCVLQALTRGLIPFLLTGTRRTEVDPFIAFPRWGP